MPLRILQNNPLFDKKMQFVCKTWKNLFKGYTVQRIYKNLSDTNLTWIRLLIVWTNSKAPKLRFYHFINFIYWLNHWSYVCSRNIASFWILTTKRWVVSLEFKCPKLYVIDLNFKNMVELNLIWKFRFKCVLQIQNKIINSIFKNIFLNNLTFKWMLLIHT